MSTHNVGNKNISVIFAVQTGAGRFSCPTYSICVPAG